MKRVFQSLACGMLIMFLAGFCYLFFARWFFKWMMAWPALFLYRFFPPPSPDQIFPMLGGTLGILCTLGVSTLAYSLLSYIVLCFIGASQQLVGPESRYIGMFRKLLD